MTDHWLQSAESNDVLVVELLLRLKHSSDSVSDSDSLRAPPPPTTSKTTVLPPRWGHRKNRSKSTTAATTNGGKEHRGSPTTHLSWSGGGGSTSDGSDEFSRPSDLSSACRSGKIDLDQNQRNKMMKMKDERQSVHVSCRVEATTETRQRGFVLPDLNMLPSDDDLATMMS